MPSAVRLTLLLVFTLTVAWGTYEFRRDNRAGLPVAKVADPAEAAPLPSLAPPEQAPPALTDFAETLARPLFLEDRRPFEAEATTAGPVVDAAPRTATRPDVKLTAVVMHEGRPIALLHSPQSGETTHLSLGDSMGGWQLVKVTDDSATLEQGQQRLELALREFESPPEPPVAGRPTPRQLAPRAMAPGSRK